MTEEEAREIVERYEALVVAAARTPGATQLSDQELLDSYRLTVRDGQLELQAIWMTLDYDVIVHTFEPTLLREGFEAEISRCG